MPRQDPSLPEGLGKAFINSLIEEFRKEPLKLETYLKEADQILTIEENYLDRPPQREFEEGGSKEGDKHLNAQIQSNYQDYRDNKRWLHED